MKNILFTIIVLMISSCLTGQTVSLIPEPSSLDLKTGSFMLSASSKINCKGDGARKTVELFNEFLNTNYGFSLKTGSGKNSIQLIADSKMKPESYVMEISADNVVIKGDDAGIFYGIQTLQQLIVEGTGGKIGLPALRIEDEPRFRYRGMMLDVARYFYSLDYIKKFLDLMSHYKLNTFHWHLTEDAGWRIEIKKYPELTRKGAWRRTTQSGGDGSQQNRIPHGGFYTQEQVKDLIRYAADRHITIIPEVEMPGHSMAALSVFPELSCTGGPFTVPETWGIREEIFCGGNDDTFSFLEDVLSEIADLFPSEYIHIGGDEAPKKRWKECPKCQARIKSKGLKDEHELQSYFIQRIEKFINSKGKKIIGWDEILDGGLAPNATVMSWRGEAGGIAAANQHHDVIMSPNNYMYLDYYQSDDRNAEPLGAWWEQTVSLSKIYNYEPYTPNIAPDLLKHIIGVQGNVWMEIIHSERNIEYMAYPRALALAEIGWSPKEKKNYESFLKRLPARLRALDEAGVAFRIPEAMGADNVKTKDGQATIDLTSLVQDARIYYTTDGSDPLLNGILYTRPLNLPLKFEGLNVKYVITLPSGRSSRIYTVR